MRNIILASALALGGASTYATATQTMFFHDGIMDIVFQEDFTPISIKAVPTAIIEAVVKNYGEGKISEVYKNELNEYKLDLSLDSKTNTVYTDENGHWINK
ncbi:hypothetical protein [Formosa sp. PL04]|uniref:hypothetical protein n=1 Tax=Formosa sp. PL04 TaxID=3081755 RepID=UPI00298195BC|nr:hypothetical protein [Formosa sp. PL04]MDW5288310.1 hypothetical protein [Formosa sp. PL04]